MIRLTYDIFCDLCQKQIDSETYNCTNHLRAEFPRPKSDHTFQVGCSVEMCTDCATPIVQAHNQVIADHLAKGKTP